MTKLAFTASLALGLACSLLGAATAAPARAAPNVVARVLGHHVAVYRWPGAARPFLTLPSVNADGAPAVLLVKTRAPGWEQVYLPVRPNGSTGWIRNAALSLAYDSYVVEVSVGRHSLTVWDGNRIIDRQPAGVGRSVLPTPRGVYYIVELLKQADAGGPYGPYAFGLSAHSDVLYSFGGGPGEIGLHGTDDPAGLGTSVSHGCVRISNAGITKLAHLLPLGTPVLITA